MPLPDERPRQSVANLIGRFENQVKRQPSSSPGSSRSLSVASNVTAGSEEVKERREWPPKPSSNNDRPPPIIPSSSWSRSQAAGSQPPFTSTPAALATQANVLDDPSSTPRPNSSASTFENIKIISLPQEIRTAEALRTDTSDAPATAKPLNKTPINTPAKASTSRPSPAAIKTPVKTPARAPTNGTPAALSVKPQHTAPGRTVIPKTPSAKTPSRNTNSISAPLAKTPTSTRPKTPSSGLFAPTAASLAKSRNAQLPLPTPTKKVALSGGSAERLSKPTAASLSRARTPTATATPTRGSTKTMTSPAGSAARAAVKPRSSTATTRNPKSSGKVVATKGALADAAVVAGVEAAVTSEIDKDHEKEEVTAPVENDQQLESLELAASESHEHDVGVEPGDMLDDETNLDKSQAEQDGSIDEEPAVSDTQVSFDVKNESLGYLGPNAEAETQNDDHRTLDATASSKMEERLDEVKDRMHHGDEIEDIVSMLEAGSISRGGVQDAPSISEDVSEIPDED